MTRLALLLLSLCLLALGCQLLHPTQMVYESRLLPQTNQGTKARRGAEGIASFAMEGVRIHVEHMSDAALNDMFPEESSQGEYSINPYTFGDFVDPAVGYVPNRFTVFAVTVENQALAKVELDPLKARLYTNRKGEVLQAYGILAGSAPRSFEAYYRARRGTSGNEFYRFNMRLGIVRSNNYNVGKKIYKGESYRGFIVFDPLDQAVNQVTLELRDFVYKFTSFDLPLEQRTLRFEFMRHTQLRQAKPQAARQTLVTGADLRGQLRVEGETLGDTTRSATTLERLVKANLGPVNQCFAREFLAGKASPGALDVRFVIAPNGQVPSAEVIQSGVVSGKVSDCVVGAVQQWQFSPVGNQAVVGKVIATCPLEFSDLRR